MSDLPLNLKLDICAELPDAIMRATAAAKEALQQALAVASTLVQCPEVPEGFGRQVQDLRVAREQAGHHLYVHYLERAGRPPLQLPEAFRPYALLSAVSQCFSWREVQGRNAVQVWHGVAGYVCAHIDELCAGEQSEGAGESTFTVDAYAHAHRWFAEHWTMTPAEADRIAAALDQDQARAINNGLNALQIGAPQFPLPANDDWNAAVTKLRRQFASLQDRVNEVRDAIDRKRSQWQLGEVRYADGLAYMHDVEELLSLWRTLIPEYKPPRLDLNHCVTRTEAEWRVDSLEAELSRFGPAQERSTSQPTSPAKTPSESDVVGADDDPEGDRERKRDASEVDPARSGMSTNVDPDAHGTSFLPPDLREAFMCDAELATSAWVVAHFIAGVGTPESDAQMVRNHLKILADAHDRAREATLKVHGDLLDTRKNRGPARFGQISGATAHEAALAYSQAIDSRIMLAVTKATGDILREAGPDAQQELLAYFGNRWATQNLDFLQRHFNTWRGHFDYAGLPPSTEMIGDMKIEAAAAARARLAVSPLDAGAKAPALPARPARHSDDFRSVHWYGADYTFTPSQAACVKVLWRNWDNGTPEVGEDTVLTDVEVDAQAKRLIDLFRDRKSESRYHLAWGTMIVQGRKGAYRLNPPEMR
jgi:hypothetical protein